MEWFYGLNFAILLNYIDIQCEVFVVIDLVMLYGTLEAHDNLKNNIAVAKS